MFAERRQRAQGEDIPGSGGGGGISASVRPSAGPAFGLRPVSLKASAATSLAPPPPPPPPAPSYDQKKYDISWYYLIIISSLLFVVHMLCSPTIGDTKTL